MSAFVVTGGAGFIGSHLVRGLLAKGEQVTVLDNFSTGRLENLADVQGKIRLVRGDLCDRTAVDEALEGADFVLHQAALPSVPRSIEDPMASDQTNVHGTVSLLEGARRAKIKRVVYAASSSAYGESEVLPKVETMSPAPLSPYAVAKLASEHYMQAYTKCFGLETVSLRYFNVFGPRQDPASQYAAVIPAFIVAALKGTRPVIYGDGRQSRDFSYIDNVIEANLLACRAPAAAAGRVFNIACGVRTTLLGVIESLSKILGTKIDPVFESGRAGDVKHSLADITAARSVLGYQGAVDFDEGLRRSVEWYRQTLGAGMQPRA